MVNRKGWSWAAPSAPFQWREAVCDRKMQIWDWPYGLVLTYMDLEVWSRKNHNRGVSVVVEVGKFKSTNQSSLRSYRRSYESEEWANIYN